MSRNSLEVENSKAYYVTSREGRVSRNRPAHRPCSHVAVTSREGRVSRNQNCTYNQPGKYRHVP